MDSCFSHNLPCVYRDEQFIFSSIFQVIESCGALCVKNRNTRHQVCSVFVDVYCYFVSIYILHGSSVSSMSASYPAYSFLGTLFHWFKKSKLSDSGKRKGTSYR